MNLSVALCTYNGEKYLREQLDSIAAQTVPPDELVVCDDGSTDGTMDILHHFERKAPFAVRIYRNQTNLGLKKNFEKTANLCRGKWISLCDQDDRWLPGKLEILGRKMEQLEANYGEATPLLIHSDAIVTDSNLNEIAGSLWAFQRAYPHKGNSLGRALNQNVATGCTALFNLALREKAFPIPGEAVMHDWWLALAACAFGKIVYIPEPTILYRQHGSNDTGARKWNLPAALRLFFDLLKQNTDISIHTRNQAKEFLDRYAELSLRQKETLTAFIKLPVYSYFRRKHLIIKYGLHFHGPLRNLGNLLLR